VKRSFECGKCGLSRRRTDPLWILRNSRCGLTFDLRRSSAGGVADDVGSGLTTSFWFMRRCEPLYAFGKAALILFPRFTSLLIQ
jgi:hypothetical protein